MAILRSLLICNEASPAGDFGWSLTKVTPIINTTHIPFDINIWVHAFVSDVVGDSPVITSMFGIGKVGQASAITQINVQSLVHPNLKFTQVTSPVFVPFPSAGQYELVYSLQGLELGRFPFWVELAT